MGLAKRITYKAPRPSRAQVCTADLGPLTADGGLELGESAVQLGAHLLLQLPLPEVAHWVQDWGVRGPEVIHVHSPAHFLCMAGGRVQLKYIGRVRILLHPWDDF